MHLSDLGRVLRSARESAGVSQSALAREIGVSVRLVSEVERGVRRNVSLDTAVRLLTAVGASLTVTAPGHRPVTIEDAREAADARARFRRSHWTGQIGALHDTPADTAPHVPSADHLARVTAVSAVASAVRSGA